MNNDNIAKEESIALNLIDNINEGYLINRDLSSIDRIISIYFAQSNETIENDQIIDFLFNCMKHKIYIYFVNELLPFQN